MLPDPAWWLEPVGLEARPLSQWLYSALAAAGLPVISVEARRTKAVLRAQVNKTDRNDARGIAHMIRANLFRPVHVKTLARTDVPCGQLAICCGRKPLPLRNDIRCLLRNSGLKVGIIRTVRLADRIRELVAYLPELAEIMACLLEAHQRQRERFAILHRKVLAAVRDDDVCLRLIAVPGLSLPQTDRSARLPLGRPHSPMTICTRFMPFLTIKWSRQSCRIAGSTRESGAPLQSARTGRSWQ